MKNALWIVSLLCLVALALAGCAAKPAAQAAQAAGEGAAAQGGENALPLMTQLLVGTFRLEGTAQAVDAEQAGKLLPLWKAYKALSSSDSVAPQELTALTEQIQETMTPQQREAITAMQLTLQDVGAVAQQQGVAMQNGGGRGNLSPEQIQTLRAQRGNNQGGPGGGGPGGFPGGGFPGGGFPGGGPGGGGQGAAAGQGNAATARSGGAFAARAMSPMIDALIRLLEAK